MTGKIDVITLCQWRDCTGCPEPAFVRNREATQRWLSSFLADGMGRGRLREMARSTGGGLGLARLTSHQVLDHLTDCIATGRLKVYGKGRVIPYESSIELATGMAPPVPPPDKPVARSNSAPVAAAAEDGAPFFETHEKTWQTGVRA